MKDEKGRMNRESDSATTIEMITDIREIEKTGIEKKGTEKTSTHPVEIATAGAQDAEVPALLAAIAQTKAATEGADLLKGQVKESTKR